MSLPEIQVVQDYSIAELQACALLMHVRDLPGAVGQPALNDETLQVLVDGLLARGIVAETGADEEGLTFAQPHAGLLGVIANAETTISLEVTDAHGAHMEFFHICGELVVARARVHRRVIRLTAIHADTLTARIRQRLGLPGSGDCGAEPSPSWLVVDDEDLRRAVELADERGVDAALGSYPGLDGWLAVRAQPERTAILEWQRIRDGRVEGDVMTWIEAADGAALMTWVADGSPRSRVGKIGPRTFADEIAGFVAAASSEPADAPEAT